MTYRADPTPPLLGVLAKTYMNAFGGPVAQRPWDAPQHWRTPDRTLPRLRVPKGRRDD